MSKLSLLLFATLLITVGCHRQHAEGNRLTTAADSTQGNFIIDTLLPTTPVKDQGQNELCWIYAMLATIETEHLTQGDSVNLSPTYMARMFLRDRVRAYYLSQGKETVSLRGMATMCLHLLDSYGTQPYDYYATKGGSLERQPNENWRVLGRKAVRKANLAIAQRSGLEALENGLDQLLDEELGVMPRYVHMLGASYSSMEFGHSVCLPGEYESLTSFSHHPFGSRFMLESPDNQLHDSFLNVPIDTLMHRIVSSLRHGHPVCWEGDTSEPHSQGVYDLSLEQRQQLTLQNTQQLRQQLYECFKTTDDHCMAIVGLAHTPDGRQFLICKNSWGTASGRHGFCFLSYEYVQLKTICVVLHADK